MVWGQHQAAKATAVTEPVEVSRGWVRLAYLLLRTPLCLAPTPVPSNEEAVEPQGMVPPRWKTLKWMCKEELIEVFGEIGYSVDELAGSSVTGLRDALERVVNFE